MYWNSTEEYKKKVKEWIKSPGYVKNLQTMQLLINKNWFQDIVKDARIACKIPPKGYKSKFFDTKQTGAYLVISDPEESNFQTKINEPMTPFIDKIMRDKLPIHFERAIKTYINYNYISAPILDFCIEAKCTGCPKHIATLPQTKKFIKKLDLMQREIEESTMDMLTDSSLLEKPYPLLLTERFDPMNSLEEKILYIEKFEKTKKKMEEENLHKKIKHSDVITRLHKRFSEKITKKLVKKFHNIYRDIKKASKERAIPLD